MFIPGTQWRLYFKIQQLIKLQLVVKVGCLTGKHRFLTMAEPPTGTPPFLDSTPKTGPFFGVVFFLKNLVAFAN